MPNPSPVRFVWFRLIFFFNNNNFSNKIKTAFGAAAVYTGRCGDFFFLRNDLGACVWRAHSHHMHRMRPRVTRMQQPMRKRSFPNKGGSWVSGESLPFSAFVAPPSPWRPGQRCGRSFGRVQTPVYRVFLCMNACVGVCRCVCVCACLFIIAVRL